MPSRNRSSWAYALPAALLLLAPFNLLASLAMDVYLSVVPEMPAILGTTPDLVQLTLSVYMVLLGAGQIVFGPLSERFGRRPVLILGGALFAAASLLLAATSSVGLFLAFRLLQAIGASAALVALFATVRDVFGGKPESALVYSLLNAMLACVPALGPILGALLAEAFGWRAIFLSLGLPAILAVMAALPFWHETRPPLPTGRGMSFLPVLASLAFWTYTLGFSAAMGTFFVFFSTAPRILIDRAGLSQLGFSLAFATVALAMIAATPFAKRLASRWGLAGSLRRGMILLLTSALLLCLGRLAGTPFFLSLLLPMWIAAIGIVLTGAVTADGALQSFGETAGTAVALYFCIQSLIVGLLGTLCVVLFGGDTAWPLVVYIGATGSATLLASSLLGRRTALRTV